MKKQCLLLAMLLALLCLNQSCSDEPDRIEGPRAVSFSLGLLQHGDAAGRVASDIPDGASVLITLTKSDGTPVLTHKRIDVLSLGNGYVTAPLSLEPGDYTLTDFWIVQDSSEVLFLTPRAGSPMAEYVSRPLPFDFSVTYDAATNIPIEVVATGNQVPEDFGYASFTLTVVDVPVPEDSLIFRVAVFVQNAGRLVMTDATLELITDGSVPDHRFNLAPGINTISLDDMDESQTVTIRINKLGYASYSRELSWQELTSAFTDAPLEVVLEIGGWGTPSAWLGSSLLQGNMTDAFTLGFKGEGAVYVDWGDNFMEKVSFNGGVRSMSHVYRPVGPPAGGFIVIRGDIGKIVSFSSGMGAIGINVVELINLRELSLVATNVPELDLSRQDKLESLSLEFGSGDVTLAPQHNLREVKFHYWETFYDPVIDNIVSNASSRGIRNGNFDYRYHSDNHLYYYYYEILQHILGGELGWDVSYH